MRLLRMVRHIKSENWFALGLEMSAIFIGIFVGFQVDRWYSAYQEAQEERHYLERLLSDMDISLRRQEAIIRFTERTVSRGDLVAASLRKGTVAPGEAEAFAEGLDDLQTIMLPVDRLATVNELIGGGNIRLLSDYSVREAMSTYAASHDQLLYALEMASDRISTIYPNLVLPLRKTLDSQSGEARVEYDLERLTSDTDFLAAVDFSLGFFRDVRSLQGLHYQRTLAFRNALAKELDEDLRAPALPGSE